MEAWGGFAPPCNGFADRRVSYLRHQAILTLLITREQNGILGYSLQARLAGIFGTDRRVSYLRHVAITIVYEL
ncbi:MAG: hypothetical protein G01um101472_384 [Parcubacteria group bacterium Gr01-1014_72]|nr:MAG: hypothetical protein G01um101472_384 [Parcubacteria group bacterium Gr01-1014_72]